MMGRPPLVDRGKQRTPPPCTHTGRGGEIVCSGDLVAEDRAVPAKGCAGQDGGVPGCIMMGPPRLVDRRRGKQRTRPPCTHTGEEIALLSLLQSPTGSSQ